MIRELRKATSDIKNEIELDETIRKPVEELREAMTLHPEELKRRDLERAARLAREKAEREEEAARKAAEEAAAKVPEAATVPAPVPAPVPPRATPSSLSLPVTSNSDKTIAMPPPGFSETPARTPIGGAPVAKVPGTIARPTLIGVPPSPSVPRPAPPPVPPGAAKLPSPAGAARPVPAPPVKKD